MTSRGSVLVVDDEEVLRLELAGYLEARGWSVESTGDGAEALRRIREVDYDVVVTDLRLGSSDGLTIVDQVRRWSNDTAVVVVTAHASVRSATEAFRRGASDYMIKPIVFEDVFLRVRRLLEFRRLTVENRYLRRSLAERLGLDGLVGRSPAMKVVAESIRRAGPLESEVLLQGETGTGKERIARAIHAESPRRDGPFVVVDCRATPAPLLESTLFGLVRGESRALAHDQEGVIRAARGGTLFLREVSGIPLDLQAKVLDVIVHRSILPMGGTVPLAVDARVISSTARDLEAQAREGRFRTDLLARIHAFRIDVPALRQRLEDLPDLVDHFIHRSNEELGLSIAGIDREALRMLSDQDWSTNLRGLRHVIQRAMILCDARTLSAREISVAGRPGDRLRDLPLGEPV